MHVRLDKGRLRKLVGKSTHLDLGGRKQPVALFDWFVYGDEQDADVHRRIDELLEYHVPAKARKHVAAERWIPFGVVGMTGSFDSYKEVAVDGTLFVDVSRVKGSDAPVVFTTQEYVGLRPTEPLEVSATSYAKLMKTFPTIRSR